MTWVFYAFILGVASPQDVVVTGIPSKEICMEMKRDVENKYRAQVMAVCIPEQKRTAA